MNDADLFDEFVKSIGRGRRLDRARQDVGVPAELDHYLGRARAAIAAATRVLSALPPIYADFVTNPQFNAFAYKHRDRYFIAFDDGRRMQILNMLGNYVEQNWDSRLVPDVEAALTRALAEVEEAFELITGTGQKVHGLHDAWDGDGWRYTAEVSNCWNDTVRPKVAKYSFVATNICNFAQPSASRK